MEDSKELSRRRAWVLKGSADLSGWSDDGEDPYWVQIWWVFRREKEPQCDRRQRLHGGQRGLRGRMYSRPCPHWMLESSGNFRHVLIATLTAHQ